MSRWAGFVEGSDAGLPAPRFADVIVRDPRTFEPVPDGSVGVIEVVSLIPRSYPGHALLTEDLGVVESRDSGPWQGKAFRVLGRLPRSELRGCSDVAATVAAGAPGAAVIERPSRPCAGAEVIHSYALEHDRRCVPPPLRRQRVASPPLSKRSATREPAQVTGVPSLAFWLRTAEGGAWSGGRSLSRGNST